MPTHLYLKAVICWLPSSCLTQKLIVIWNAKFQNAVGVVFKRFDLCQLERCLALRLLGYCPTEWDYPGPWFLPRYMSTATNGNQIRVDLLVQERKKCFPFSWRRWIVQGLCLLRFWNRKPHYQSQALPKHTCVVERRGSYRFEKLGTPRMFFLNSYYVE